jgi:hypothetical protein
LGAFSISYRRLSAGTGFALNNPTADRNWYRKELLNIFDDAIFVKINRDHPELASATLRQTTPLAV